MSKYIDLINLLTEEDKERIKNYIFEYGVIEEHFIGLEEWLQNWSHSNQTLFKLLGKKFIEKVPYSYEKDEREIRDEMRVLLNTSLFKESYHNFYHKVIIPLYIDEEVIDSNARHGFNHLSDIDVLVEDKVEYPIKIKLENKKCLQIPAGTKPMRAFSKIISYFKDEWNFEGFEEFRIRHSIILNDKIVKGQLCISIHPLDYMTMSDNANNWGSCMSWSDHGCYHIGTVEMMNSNNVLCCYLDREDMPFYFAKNGNNDPLFTWNNKKWRNLVYITKDIIMAGKAYPYRNKELSIALINNVKQLAKENLNWDYKFGPEEYKDMQYINSCYSMDRAKGYIHMRNMKKHNIIWDTKGMYNDMLNDHDTVYWCYRNKPKQNKVISVSGKAPCLCCGEQVIDFNEYDGYDEYNERYNHCGYTICPDCFENFISCDSCGDKNATEKRYRFVIGPKSENKPRLEIDLCPSCAKKKVRRCPDCGKLIYISNPLFHLGNFDKDYVKENSNYISFENGNSGPWSLNHRIVEDEYFGCYVCEECAKNIVPKLEFIEVPTKWHYNRNYVIVKPNDYDFEKYQKYLWEELEIVDLEELTKNTYIEESYFIKDLQKYANF